MVSQNVWLQKLVDFCGVKLTRNTQKGEGFILNVNLNVYYLMSVNLAKL